MNNVNAVTNVKRLVELLVQCRTEKGLALEDVAKALKMSAGAISNIERGAMPRRTTQLKLENFLRKHGYALKAVA